MVSNSKLLLKLNRIQSSDDEFSQLGTILSERNEVRRQLQNADGYPVPSPTRGGKEKRNDETHFEFNFRGEESSEDGNVMEQTLGRTLT